MRFSFRIRLLPRRIRIKAALIALLCAMILPSTPEAGKNNIRFEHISLDQGLSHSTVTCIIQDSMGFLWVGTQDGLNKYDGYGFKVYRHDAGNPESLSSNFVLSLHEDTSGNI